MIGEMMMRLILAAALAVAASPANADLYEKAKAEGSVVWYAIPLPFNDRVAEAFEARYPGVKVEKVYAGGAQLIQRFKLERSKSHQGADCLSSGLTEAFPELRRDGHLAALDGLPGWSKRPAWSRDPKGHYFYYVNFRMGWMYNTTLVKESELPASFKDLASPAWTDKLALFDPATAGVAVPVYRWLVEARGLGFDWLTAVRANKPYLAANAAQLDEAVATGRRALALTRDTEAYGAIKKGAPLAFKVPSEGTMLHLMPVAINRDAPHPNAARLFVSWLLSDEAQALLAKEKVGVPLTAGPRALKAAGAWTADAESYDPAKTKAFLDRLLETLKGS